MKEITIKLIIEDTEYIQETIDFIKNEITNTWGYEDGIDFIIEV